MTEPAASASLERVGRLLKQGHLQIVGRILSSSNLIFLAAVTDDELETLAVYKPCWGERPLWDFPRGTLCLREVAACAISQAIGWPRIPPAVLRDGPHGPGALQLYIAADPEVNYFTLDEGSRPELLPVALFDLLANNADRKGGHLLVDRSGCLWAIDNALTFHVEPKLRTVIWDFAGEPIPEAYRVSLGELQRRLSGADALGHALSRLLAAEEIAALRARLAALLRNPVFPPPDPTRRQLPWPLI